MHSIRQPRQIKSATGFYRHFSESTKATYQRILSHGVSSYALPATGMPSSTTSANNRPPCERRLSVRFWNLLHSLPRCYTALHHAAANSLNSHHSDSPRFRIAVFSESLCLRPNRCVCVRVAAYSAQTVASIASESLRITSDSLPSVLTPSQTSRYTIASFPVSRLGEGN